MVSRERGKKKRKGQEVNGKKKGGEGVGEVETKIGR